MAMMNPKGRANYEQNSWNGQGGGPRESPEKGFQSYPSLEEGPKLRLRSETFADHYSQARQFYLSQTQTEQQHIADAFAFELSKVETVAIRARIVSHLLNVDEDLAKTVAKSLRLKEMPAPAEAAMPTRMDLKTSPKLSIILNGPESFKGRKVGVLVTDGVDAGLLSGLKSAIEAEGAMMEIVAPMVGGVEASDGSWIEADEKLDGGPSVLFDAVALLPSAEGAQLLAKEPAARDFVADAFAHLKFIGHGQHARPLLEKASIEDDVDEGCVALAAADDVEAFLQACRKLRFWQREGRIKQN
jgi:catalase